MATLTAANAVIVLSIPLLFPTPVQLQGFTADDVLDTEALVAAETIMGVDGIMSAGFIFAEVKQSYILQADSASNALFDAWYSTQQAQRDLYFATGVVTLTSLGTKWALTKGALTSYIPLPGIKKLVQPRKYGITWESVSPAVA